MNVMNVKWVWWTFVIKFYIITKSLFLFIYKCYPWISVDILKFVEWLCWYEYHIYLVPQIMWTSFDACGYATSTNITSIWEMIIVHNFLTIYVTTFFPY